MEGTKRWKDGEKRSGTWAYGEIGDEKDCYLKKGKIDGGYYEGLIREGLFTTIRNIHTKQLRCLLKSGKITFENGDIWEGEFRDFEFYKPGSSENEGEFRLLGSVSPSKGKKKEGLWKCINTGNEYKIEKYLGGIEGVY